MPIFKWIAWRFDEEDLDHIAEHGVTQTECEQVAKHLIRYEQLAEGRYKVHGITDEGRHLTLVGIFIKGGGLLIRTAYDMKPSDKTAYRRRSK